MRNSSDELHGGYIVAKASVEQYLDLLMYSEVCEEAVDEVESALVCLERADNYSNDCRVEEVGA